MQDADRQALDAALKNLVREALRSVTPVPMRTFVRLRREWGPEPGSVRLPQEPVLVPDLHAVTFRLVRGAYANDGVDRLADGIDRLAEVIAARPKLAERSLAATEGQIVESRESQRWASREAAREAE